MDARPEIAQLRPYQPGKPASALRRELGIERVVKLASNEGPLGPEYLDHALTGDWADHRECHVGGDFLLVYKLVSRGSTEDVIFVRAGTHAELFE